MFNRVSLECPAPWIITSTQCFQIPTYLPTYRPPLPNLFTYIGQPHGYYQRQSTCTQLITSCPADPPWRQSDQPCLVLPPLYRHYCYCRPTPDDGNYYYYLIVLRLLQLLLLLLQLLLLLLLQRPNEFYTESDHCTWYTVHSNNPMLHLQRVSIQQLLQQP